MAYASGKKDRFAYDDNSVTATIDGIAKTTAYNAKGEVTSITDAAGSITYNLRADGQTASIVAPGNVTTTFSYDSYGRQTGINDPSAGLRTFGYDAAGNLNLEKDARNKQIKYTYDARNRLTKKEIVGEQTLTITYNADNLLQSAVSGNGTKIEYAYDALLRPDTIKETALDGKWLRKTILYENGQVKTINYTANTGNLATENYTYAHGHNTEVTLTSPHFTGTKSVWKLTTENTMGQATGATTGKLYRTYAYDGYGLPTARRIYIPNNRINVKEPVSGFAQQVTARTMTTAAATARTMTTAATAGFGPVINTNHTMVLDVTVLQDFSYSFDAQTGNLNWRKDVSSSRNLQENFTYDDLNRLTGINSVVIDYDNKGNILRNSVTGTFEYANAQKPYRHTKATPYNESMHLQDQTITYNAMQRPASITEGNRTATLAYNAFGNRVKMQLKTGSTPALTRYYFGNKYETDETSSGTKEKLYLCGDAYSAPAVFVQEKGTWSLYYIGRDYQGSITHIFSEDGTVKQELSYDAWGRLRNPANQEVYAIGSEPELFLGRGYTGHEHLTPFGLINMNARLYDAALGRFLSPDPYIQNMTNSQNYNRYSYCLNNPLKYTDPSGEYYWDPDSQCYRDGWGNRVEYGEAYRYFFNHGAFRPGGSMFRGISFVSNFGGGYGSYGGYGGYGSYGGYGGYGFTGSNFIDFPDLRDNGEYSFWAQTAYSEVSYDQNGYHYINAIGVTSTRVTFNQQIQDWLNATSFMSQMGVYAFSALERLSYSEGYWLGKNGKYYKTNWGGNQYTGSRAGALKAAKLYKKAGWVATAVVGLIDIGVGYMEDGNTVGYNAGKAMAGTAGGIGGAWGGASAGAAIGGCFGGIGAIPGAVVGGIIGSWLGGWGGSEAGEAIYDGIVK